MYCTGTGVVRNLAEAVRWYPRSAEHGDRYAQYNLAIMLLKGQGIAQDVEEAFRWCCLAAEQGLAEAQRQLGDLYRAGQGWPQMLRWPTPGTRKRQSNTGKPGPQQNSLPERDRSGRRGMTAIGQVRSRSCQGATSSTRIRGAAAVL